jgi:pyruvate/2-oxoglutarate dehydrogenase complex dihydrolipoamide acyltransferase (E2) component
MGSFAISALGSHGAAIVDTIPVWTSFLNYVPIDRDGGMDIYLSDDHRVIDGGEAARAIRAPSDDCSHRLRSKPATSSER